MDPIEAALDDLRSQKSPNISKTACDHAVSRSTLSKRWNGVHRSKRDGYERQQFLSSEQEETLVNYINKLCDRGIPPTTKMVWNFAYEIAKKRPGKNWPERFLKRHEAKLKSCYLTGLDLCRSKADSVKQITLYFEQVRNANSNLLLLLNFVDCCQNAPISY